MKLFAAVLLLTSATASAAGINMDDPRRAVGREDDVRVDAQLVQDTVGPGVPVAVTYQIQNFTQTPVAIAHKVSSASYDADTRTITVSIGSEVPDVTMPNVVVIAPGEKKVFRTSATPALNAAAIRTTFGGTPRYVQVKVSILRDLGPFRTLIDRQANGPQPFPDELFDRWFESNDTIVLNAVPVTFNPSAAHRDWDAESGHGRGTN